MGVGVSRRLFVRCESWSEGSRHRGLGTTIWGSRDTYLGLMQAFGLANARSHVGDA
jgi:hypothetical protein